MSTKTPRHGNPSSPDALCNTQTVNLDSQRETPACFDDVSRSQITAAQLEVDDDVQVNFRSSLNRRLPDPRSQRYPAAILAMTIVSA